MKEAEKRYLVRSNILKFCKQVIVGANTAERALADNPHLKDEVIDLEGWQVARHFASKIQHAVETDSWIDPKWVDGVNIALKRPPYVWTSPLA